jgi:hypothetical protein
MPRTGIEPVILSLLVIRFTTEPTGLLCELVKEACVVGEYQDQKVIFATSQTAPG